MSSIKAKDTTATKANDEAFHDALDEEAPGPPISVPDAGDTGEGGKLKMIVQLVKKCLGVKDIAAMRLSLPASLLEPIPNLEFSQYLDRPDIFAAINDSDDDFMRMLAVVRFAFTKDLKYVHGKVCKPYNSVLGEHFRAHWDIIPVQPARSITEPPIPAIYTAPAAAASDTISPHTHTPRHLISKSETASLKSGKSSKSTRSGLSLVNKPPAAEGEGESSPATSPRQPPESDLEVDPAGISRLSLGSDSSQDDDVADVEGGGALTAAAGDENAKRVRVVYLTEQVSHHPPISAYYAACPARHLELMGIDQISAKVSGTTLRVAPGSFNKGIHINITGGPGEGESYHISHPTASVNGILRGSFYVTVGDSCIVTCSGGKGAVKYRTIIEYKDESWIGKPHFLIEGVIHTYIEGETAHESWIKCKHVPQSKIVAHLDGSWKHVVRWKYSSSDSRTSTSSSRSPSSTLLQQQQKLHPSQSSLLHTASALHASASTPNVSLPRLSTSSSHIHLPKAAGDHATLVDVSTLKIVPKGVRPLEKQHERESRKLWERVTNNLLSKEYGDATREKVAIEQRQRDEAAERKRRGVEFEPMFFEKGLERGWAGLTEEGRKAVKEEMEEDSRYCLEHGYD